MRTTLTRRLTATTVAASALILTTGVAAHAQSSTMKDKYSDVVSTDVTMIGDSLQQQESMLDQHGSTASGVDLRTMRVSHGKTTVTIKLTFAELHQGTVAVVAFRLDGEAEPERFLTNTTRRRGTVTNAHDKKKCNVPIVTRTGRKGTIQATIDRSCLDDPKRLKAAAIAVGVRVDDTSLSIRQDVLSSKRLKTVKWSSWLSPSR